MAPRPRLTSRNVQAFILALLLTLSEVAFHATRVATWTWQPELQPLVPRPAGFSSASQSTWPEASSSVIREDSNQSGLALPDLEQNGRMWSSSNGAGGDAGGGSGADEGSDGWGGGAAPLAFIFPVSKAVLHCSRSRPRWERRLLPPGRAGSGGFCRSSALFVVCTVPVCS